MNLAIRDIRHNLGRFLLTSIGLGLLLGVVLSMIGIYRGLVADALSLVRGPGADLWVVETGTRGPFAEGSRIPGDTREAVARLAGVTEAGSMTFQSLEALHRGRKLRLQVVGHEPDRLGGPAVIIEGRGLARGRFELIADVKTGLVLGERIALGGDVFTVVGLTRGAVSSSGDPVVWMSLRDSQVLQFRLSPAPARREAARGPVAPGAPDTVNAVVARVAANVPVESVTEAARRWKHLAAMTQDEQETILTRSVVEKARQQIGLFTTVLLTVSTVIIALIIYTMTMDKLKEIATLKLIGAPDGRIVGLILQQALALGLIGFSAGATLITLVKDHFPRRVVMLPEDAMALGVIVVVVCVLASGLGVRLALKVDPATALGS
jgi:putative ABC transport system permease protein